jgi:hypothetical protein
MFVCACASKPAARFIDSPVLSKRYGWQLVHFAQLNYYTRRTRLNLRTHSRYFLLLLRLTSRIFAALV